MHRCFHSAIFLLLLRAVVRHVCLKLPQLSAVLFQQSIACQATCDRLSLLLGKFLVSRGTTNVSGKQSAPSLSRTRKFKKLAATHTNLSISYIKCLRKSTFASISPKRKFYEAIFVKYCNNPPMNKFSPINAGFTF